MNTKTKRLFFEISDDHGVWVVITSDRGRWGSMEAAQKECDQRNFADGVADERGHLLDHRTRESHDRWFNIHLARKDCTCLTPARRKAYEQYQEERP